MDIINIRVVAILGISEVDETLKRIQSHKGVVGVIILNNEGIAIKSTMDNSTTIQYCSLMQQLTAKARNAVREIDPTNDLTFLRIRSKKNEIMIAPESDYITICVQSIEQQ